MDLAEEAHLLVAALITIGGSISSRITKPLRELGSDMAELGKGSWQPTKAHSGAIEIADLLTGYNAMVDSLHALTDEITREQIEKRKIKVAMLQSQLDLLQSQINPHFIYNSMNMIKWMARIQKSESIEDALTRLENMLHPLFSNDQPFCTLEEELKYCSDFISLSNLRYGGAIRLNIKVKKTLKAFYIFRLLLQPIIENAVVHGFIEKTGKCVVAILCEELEDALMIHVCDNGQGMPEGMLGELQASLRKGTMSEAEADDRTKHGSFIGLRNVNGRIKSCFGAQYGLNVESKPGHGTKVCVLVPKITRENMKNF